MNSINIMNNMIDTQSETLFLSDDLIFHTIEGEGKHVGMPSVFMRLAMCNLTCKAWATDDNEHGCDSYISWSVKNKLTFDDIFKMMEEKGYVKFLERGDIWKITGGEPLIQAKQLIKLFTAFHAKYGFTPRIDFESNATIKPPAELCHNFNPSFTLSPKLSTNGDPESKTYKPDVIDFYLGSQIQTRPTFKFVISCSEDIDEVYNKYVKPHSIPSSLIWFMPCCGSRREHIENSEAVAEYAKAMGVNFSPRLQLVIWDKALRV